MAKQSCVRRLRQADKTGIGFLEFANSVIELLASSGRTSTVARYSTSINSFRRFTSNKDVALAALDSRLIVEYDTYLDSLGLKSNSRSFYMRSLRAIYNRAVDQEIIEQRWPFRRVYTGVAHTRKRAVTYNILRLMKEADLIGPVAFARDIFLFSFYTRGMAMVDIALLLKTDLKGHNLIYRRCKTSQLITIRWEPEMEEIVSRHSNPDSPYLLPLIADAEGDIRRQYLTASHRINRHLKKLGQTLGLADVLTSYVARHSWASIAMSQNVPLSVISKAMGHDSEKTTRIYLATLDTSEIDKANRKIINLI